MEFFRRARGRPARLGVFPGTFNPVTVAHMALAGAALRWVDEVVFALPRSFPHKPYSGATFTQRVEMLAAAIAKEPGFSLASTAGGLFAEIAAECRRAYGEVVALSFLCGRDAAERVAGWNYGEPGAFAGMLADFDLLVAARDGDYHPAPQLKERVRGVELAPGFENVSATEVRRRIAYGEPWEQMAPAAVREIARRIYGAR